MAGSRSYRRNSNGRFAGSADPGAKVTQGRAGGFANASFRSRVSNQRASRARRQALTKTGVKVAIGAGLAAGAIGASARSSPTGSIGNMRAGIRTAANIVKGRSS